nr:MAG TPA: Fructose-bisphosphate aldolase class-II [Bacteriophage sp.]
MVGRQHGKAFPLLRQHAAGRRVPTVLHGGDQGVLRQIGKR